MGFETQQDSVEISGDQNLELTLKESAFVTDAVIISAVRASQNTPTTFSTIGKEEIERQNLAQDLPYLLSNQPSVVATSDAGTGVGYTGLRIRGSDITRINVTINGIPLNDPESHAVYWVDIPDFASSVNSLQLQRGVGSSTNGAGAFRGIHEPGNQYNPIKAFRCDQCGGRFIRHLPHNLPGRNRIAQKSLVF